MNNLLFPNIPAVDAGPGLNKKGIAFANETRFEANTYSEPVTHFITGVKAPKYEGLLNFLAPSVTMPRRFEFKAFDKNDHFLTEVDDQRAIGSAFKKVEYKGTTEQSKTFNKGLTITVDHEDAIGDAWRERYAMMLKNRLQLNEIMRAVAILKGGATNVAKTWTSGEPDPDGDLLAQLDLAGDELGLEPNRIAWGKGPWMKRQGFYRTNNTPYAGSSALMMPEALAGLLGVESIRVVSNRYQETRTAKKKILGMILMFMAEDSLLKDDPSHIKRFVSPTESGGDYRVHVEEKMKFTDITVEHYSNIVLPGTMGLRMITVS